jgi:hypothetical protein
MQKAGKNGTTPIGIGVEHANDFDLEQKAWLPAVSCPEKVEFTQPSGGTLPRRGLFICSTERGQICMARPYVLEH